MILGMFLAAQILMVIKAVRERADDLQALGGPLGVVPADAGLRRTAEGHRVCF